MIALCFSVTVNCQGKVKDFNKDTDILVLPLDVTKFDTHQDALKTVLDHFGQVKINTIQKLFHVLDNEDIHYMIP